jgi:glycosyltransferase involved in cell wall biosynthesis
VSDGPETNRGRPRAVCVFLTWPWPANSGGRIRAAGIVEALRADHDVVVLAADHAESGYEAWDAAVRKMRERRASPADRSRDILEGVVFGDHTVARRAHNAHLSEAFGEVLAHLHPALVVLDRPFFGDFITRSRAIGAMIAIDADERLSRVARSVAQAPHMSLWSRARAAVEISTLGRMEQREYRRADRIWVGSTTEQRNFLSILGPDRTHVVPNVVPGAALQRCDGSIHSVAFVGWYGHPPNEAAALELMSVLMPAIRASGGPERLVLIGRGPTRRMLAAAQGQRTVEITGELDDVHAALCAAGLLVLPIRAGGGTRIKALEAAALGVPIVSTALGVEGLGFEPLVHYVPADTASEFAAAIVSLTRNESQRLGIVEAARAQCLTHHSPAAVLDAVRSSLRPRVAGASSGSA